jgi:hypothetical protein
LHLGPCHELGIESVFRVHVGWEGWQWWVSNMFQWFISCLAEVFSHAQPHVEVAKLSVIANQSHPVAEPSGESQSLDESCANGDDLS